MIRNLKEARDAGKIAEFAADRDGASPGDEAAFNRALASMVQTSKEAPAASKRRRRDG